ncbi:hypothetical protein DKX38_007247 [Salix brachista]|uniref:Uncharacterized protein n=1 Tax=Salix brachista TaxID=2182728 RepID=A0A5N5MN33_9ROSI|nr:hypothetical protein DKX38_007247 [Salix brachista]
MLSLTCPPMYLSGSFLPELAEGFWVYCNDRFQRGLKRKPVTLFEKLCEASHVFLDGYKRNTISRYILSMLSPRFSGGLEQKMEVPDGAFLSSETAEHLLWHIQRSYAIAFEIFLMVKTVANYVFKLSYFNEVFGKLGDLKRLAVPEIRIRIRIVSWCS